MTMHGMFWRFPRTFARAASAGIAPRSTYLRVVGDFARWGDRVVFAATTRRSRSSATRESPRARLPAGQSAIEPVVRRAVAPRPPGPAAGTRRVWVRDDVRGGEPSEPFLFAGFRTAHGAPGARERRRRALQLRSGPCRRWPVAALRSVTVPAHGYVPVVFAADERGVWIRVTAGRDCRGATAFFEYSNVDRDRSSRLRCSRGFRRGAGRGRRVARVGPRRRQADAAPRVGGRLFELDAQLALSELRDAKTREWMAANLSAPRGILQEDAASIVYADEAGRRWRLPGRPGAGVPDRPVRVDREVSTERDLFNAAASSTNCRRTTRAASRWCGPSRRTSRHRRTTARGAG